MDIAEYYQGLRKRLNSQFGGPRRRELMRWMLQHGSPFDGIPANCSVGIIIRHDPDIQKLLKQGKLRRVRVYRSVKCRRTYLKECQ